jgi:hypothetical protein
VSEIPAGTKVFVPMLFVRPFISSSFLDNKPYVSWHMAEWEVLTGDDLVRQGFDYVCAANYPLPPVFSKPAYLKDLERRYARPAFVLPQVSHLYGRINYLAVQPPGNGESFNLGLNFFNPRAGDYAGVRGRIPALPSEPGGENTPQDLILRLRIHSGASWLPGFLRREILVDNKTVWLARDAKDATQMNLSLPIQARSGSEIRIQRTDYRPDATWGFGPSQSQMKVDGLKLYSAETGRPIPVSWTYTGQNGGPRAPYGMRRDWFHNANPVPLLDMGFDGEQPLVEAWRPDLVVTPGDASKFRDEPRCRQMANIETAVGLGMNGSNAVRFRVGYPAKESVKLSIMQPIAYPACQKVREVWIHYRMAGGNGENRGQNRLQLAATGFGLSGEYVDRADVEYPLPVVSGEWHTVALDVKSRWKSRHARTDLMDFLEISIGIESSPDSVCNCLIDNVELESRMTPKAPPGKP